ncbi:MAG: hypothetical protein WD275_01635 [Rhodothermales bacterium]
MDEPPNDNGRRSIDDPDFWQNLQSTFMTALDLLQEIAEAKGIDITPPATETIRDSERQLDEQARNHPLALSAEEYARLVNHWFHQAKDRIKRWSRDAARVAELESTTSSVDEDVTSLQQAIEQIATYRYQIHVKLARALRSRMRAELPALASIAEDDTDAAAHALTGIDTSIAMWMRVLEIFPEEEDSILNILIHLNALREGIVVEFSPPSPQPHPSSRSGRHEGPGHPRSDFQGRQ